MNSVFRWMKWTVVLTVLVTVGVLSVGCSSSGYAKGDKTAANIQKAADRIDELPGEIEEALGSLSQLVNHPEPDLRPQFKAFSKNLKVVESSADHIAAARKAMADSEQKFFDKWDEQLAEIHNEDIKARSQSRKEEVRQKMMAIKQRYEEGEQGFKPFVADLRDVQRALSIDLTPEGVSTVRPIVGKAMQDVGPLNDSIQQLALDFRALGVAMSSVAPKTSQ